MARCQTCGHDVACTSRKRWASCGCAGGRAWAEEPPYHLRDRNCHAPESPWPMIGRAVGLGLVVSVIFVAALALFLLLVEFAK